MQEQLYGRAGQATANYINAPSRFQSKNTRWEFNVDKANKVLDEAGWKRGADGIRAKDGKRLKFLLQTSINPLRQKEQAIIKQAAAKAGIEMELKTVVASVFFGSDEANPDTTSDTSAPTSRCTPGSDERRAPAVHAVLRVVGRSPPRRTSSRAATRRAGATRSSTARTRPPRPRWTR